MTIFHFKTATCCEICSGSGLPQRIYSTPLAVTAAAALEDGSNNP